MNATSRFLPSAISASSVQGPSAMTWPASTRWPSATIGFWLMQVPWLLRRNFEQPVGAPGAVVVHDGDVVGGELLDDTGLLGDDDVTGVDGGAVLHAGADQRRLAAQQRDGLALHVRRP